MRNPFKIIRPVTPVNPPAQPQFPSTPVRLVRADSEEKPWPIWAFILYLVALAIIWLIAYPVINDIVEAIVIPLGLPGYLELFFEALPWILFIGFIWIAFRKTFRREGQ